MFHTCGNFMMTVREICFSDEGDWGLNEGDFLTTCSSCFSYHFHMDLMYKGTGTTEFK